LLGVFAAYAMMLPVSRSMEQLAAADLKPFEAVKEILIANYSNFSPMIAVEYGRKVMFTDQRPTMKELSEGVMATSGNKLTG
jgi:chemotaxis protein MotA